MPNENIIRPPVLNLNDNVPHTSGSQNTNPLNLSQLKEVISEIIKAETQQAFAQITYSTTRINGGADQTIDPKYLNDLNDMDKIPDVVKSLCEFSGQPGEFGSWKKSVERILKIYDNLKGTPKYYGILSVVRNKIVGHADTALESYNTPLDWEKISKCLTLHYADKRDLGTLEYQMTTLVQRNCSIPEFYQQVYRHLSLILNKLSSMDMSQDAMNVMTQAYRDKALDTFVRGLKGDLPRLLSMRGPTDLPEALHLCLKLENVQYRVQHSHGNARNPQFSLPPPIPPRRIITQPQRNFHRPQARNFYPELLHNPQSSQYFPKPPQFFQQYPQKYPQRYDQQPLRPPNRNYLPKPEPMDIDRSIHSRQVNYQNRPQTNELANKRPQSNQIHPNAKFQRIHHTEQLNEDLNLQYYHEQMPEYDSQFDQTLVEYTSSQQIPDPIEDTESYDPANQQEVVEQLDDIHFLE